MRYVSIAVSFVFFSTVLSAERYAVRPLDPVAADILDRAVTTSEVIRSLVATLAASDVIVHVETSRHLPAGIAGTTRFVTNRGGYRYLRVTIWTELSKQARIAILAHELKHACEVAESHAGDADSLRQLFASAGQEANGFYETPAALAVEQLVRQELRLLQAEPVVKFHH